MIRSYQQLFNRIFVFIDIINVIVSLLLAWWFKFKSGLFDFEGALPLTSYLKPLILFVPLYILLNYLFHLYESKRSKSFVEEFLAIVKVNTIGLIVAMSILFIVKEVHYSRAVLVLFVTINTLLMLVERFSLRSLLKYFRSQGYNIKYLLILGAGPLGKEFLGKVRENRAFGYEVIGFLDDDQSKQNAIIDGVRVLGIIDDLEKVIAKHHIDEVIIALPLRAYAKLKAIIQNCEKLGLKALIIPDYFKYIPARPEVDDFDGIPLVNIRHVPLDDIFNYIIKRTFDIVVSLTALIILSPLLLIIAVGVKLTSPGPVIFKQERVGLHRKKFNMYKFRSMKVSDDKTADTVWTTADDPRKTRFGTFLRKTSLDELPQLFNVLKGDMSLIGPRPERPFFVDKFKEEIPKYMIKHHVRPGITGWAQVNGWRGDTSISERIKCDLYYVENWNLLLDLKIIWLTIKQGFINKNAY